MLNLFATGSLALMVRYLISGGRWSLLASGACVAAATLVKPIAALHGIVYAVTLGVRRGWNRATDTPRMPPLLRVIGHLVLLAFGFALTIGLAGLVLATQGAFSTAIEDAVRYGRALATDTLPEQNAPAFWLRWLVGNADPWGNLPWPFGKTQYLVWWGTGCWPLWMASVPALAWLAFRRSSLGRESTAARRLVVAWTLSAWVQVVLPGLYWQHYYLLPTPGVALAIALVFGDAMDTVADSRSTVRRIAGAIAMTGLLGAVGWTAVIQVRDYLLVPPEQLTIRYKGGGQWVVLRELGRELGRRAEVWDDPHLFVWGIQSPLYFYSGLDGVTPQVFADNLIRDLAETDHPLIRPRIERTMRDLRTHRPELIFAGYAPFSKLRSFLLENYRPSRLVIADRPLALAGGGGLWVRPDRYEEFESGMVSSP